MTYPPPYNPAFTSCSRRLLTLAAKKAEPSTPVLQSPPPLDLSLGLSFDKNGREVLDAHRPQTSSSVYSEDDPASGVVRVPGPREAAPSRFESRGTPETCAECVKSANTFMVEVINYPTLQLARERASVLNMGEYDAVLLLYDVGSRESFDIVPVLHSEVILRSRFYGKRSSWRSQGSLVKEEPIIALAGNKADFDSEGPDPELTFNLGKSMERWGQNAHPTSSGSLDTIYSDEDEPIRSPSSLNISMHEFVADGRRSAMSLDTSSTRSGAKLVKRKSTQSVRVNGDGTLPRMSRRASKRELANMWLDKGIMPREGATLDEVDEMAQMGGKSYRRQVARAEGADLARQLQLRVPFLETSSKTGQNVEEMFEAVVRQVLVSKGLKVLSTVDCQGSKPCRRHSATDSKFSSAANSPTDVGPEGKLAIHPSPPRQVAGSGDEWPSSFGSGWASEIREEVRINPAPVSTNAKAKKQGVLRRVSSIFGKKKQMSVAGVSA